MDKNTEALGKYIHLDNSAARNINLVFSEKAAIKDFRTGRKFP
jgi:hypothetical protein